MNQTSDNLLEQLRGLVAKRTPLTHQDADSFAILFEWLDDRIMAGQFPADYVRAFNRVPND